MIQVGVLGASGFVGSRLVEIFHLERTAKVVPIVRSTNSLARLARFSLDWRVADAVDGDALADAFRGCEVIVHAVHGPYEVIVDAARVAYRAAQRSGARRIVYLSTAVVHGQNPQPGTDERSPLHTRHPFAYNNAKVRAEQEFQRARKGGGVELVVLRPAIVFGPRDRWVSGVARTILERTAYVVKGTGICNTIYVDNLVHAIRLAMTADVDGEVFFVGDRETVTWSDLYRRVAAALGSQWQVPEIDKPFVVPEHVPILDRLKEFDVVRAAASNVPQAWKFRLREALDTLGAVTSALRQGVRPAGDPWQIPEESIPQVPLEAALLHQCRHKFSYARASNRMGYEPLLTFDEGLMRTLEWLKFVDFPVVNGNAAAPGPRRP